MNCGKQRLGPGMRKEGPAIARDSELAAHEGLSRRRAKAHDHVRLNYSNLRLEPGTACRNLDTVRLAMNAAFAALDKLEVLDRVCDINLAPVNAGFFQRAIQELAGWSYKRFSRQIFLFSGLFSDP